MEPDFVRRVIDRTTAAINASADELTALDQAIGDGDHGVGMARGFEAVRHKLEDGTFSSLEELLKAVGTTLLTSAGGAAGAVFGTLFRGAARRLGDRTGHGVLRQLPTGGAGIRLRSHPLRP